MTKRTVTVEVDVGIEEFETEALREELIRRGIEEEFGINATERDIRLLADLIAEDETQRALRELQRFSSTCLSPATIMALRDARRVSRRGIGR